METPANSHMLGATSIPKDCPVTASDPHEGASGPHSK